MSADVWAGDTQAVETLKGLGAMIKRDGKLPGKPVTEVYAANLKKPDVNKAMDAIRSLKGLRRLDLMNSDVGNDGAKGLSALKELRHLTLYGNSLTDNGRRS
jgi:hypothetical protein